MTNKYFPESISIAEAAELQTQFADDIVLKDILPADPKTACGIAIYSHGVNVVVSLVLYDIKEGRVKSKHVQRERMSFPPLPGCEGFHEGRVVADAIKNFDKADVYLINGHGIDHPRGLGIASHVGLALDIPTIAASVQLMCGTLVDEADGKYIYNNGRKVGKIVKKEIGSPAVFVSPGHRVTVDSAAKIVEKLMRSKIPEPIKAAQDALIGELQKPAGLTA